MMSYGQRRSRTAVLESPETQQPDTILLEMPAGDLALS